MLEWRTDLKDWLEIVNYVTVIGGVLWAVVQWPKARGQRIEAEREQSYAALNDHFLKFLELQVSAPGLGTSASDRERVWDMLSPQDQARQRVLFDYLASILERAHYFLHESGHKAEWDAKQWKEWEDWIERYARNPNFRAFWQHLHDSGEEASYGDAFVALVHRHVGIGTTASRAAAQS